MSALVNKLRNERDLTDGELKTLLETSQYDQELTDLADQVRKEIYGTKVYLRGLIEFTNYCKNNCYYCGIRRDNRELDRYRLTPEEIYSCCETGYGLGFRTFVLQGGDDPYFSDEIFCEIIAGIKRRHPDCAVTLSIGEKTYESYLSYFHAGADRFLLRHETADPDHYGILHPDHMSLETRRKCLHNLKEIGYQVGSGFMVGSPGQTTENLIKDLRFLQELKADMIGIGPYLSHKDTPFRDCPDGDVDLCLRLIAVLRLMFPYSLIPATTALGTIHPQGREMGLKAGANVVMPNLSPVKIRKLYELYDNKICTGEESAECRSCLERRVTSAGYQIVSEIGHAKSYQRG